MKGNDVVVDVDLLEGTMIMSRLIVDVACFSRVVTVQLALHNKEVLVALL